MMRVYSKLFDLKRTAMLSARIFILAVALTTVTVAGNAKTSGGSIAATTMMAIEKNNREAAQRARLLAPASTDRYSMCTPRSCLSRFFRSSRTKRFSATT